MSQGIANSIKLIECPRDAMQGWKSFIPTDKKIEYLQQLLKVGFDTLDCGSFVSAKAIPQMADTAQVLHSLEMKGVKTRLLVIVANARGAEEACRVDQVNYLGFPFSVSETFQQRNTNSSIADSLQRVKIIQELCRQAGKELVVYLSMGFGNPYNDPYSASIVYDWARKLSDLGVRILSLADTVGLARPEQVFDMTSFLVAQMPDCEIGVHLHSTLVNWKIKTEAAWRAGCRRFDGALKGIGGCPLADDELVGNMDSELLIGFFEEQGMQLQLNKVALLQAAAMASEIFS